MNNYTLSRKTKNVIFRIIELFFIFIWVFPLIWLVITSLKLENEVVTKTFTFWPPNPTLANYTKAFTSTNIYLAEKLGYYQYCCYVVNNRCRLSHCLCVCKD